MRRSPSPLAKKSKGKTTQYREIREIVPDGPECLPLPSDSSDISTVDSEEDEDSEVSPTTEEESEDDEEEWMPPAAPTPKPRACKGSSSRFSSVSSAEMATTATKTGTSKAKVSKLKKELQALSLGRESDSDLSAYIHPSKKATAVDKKSANGEEELGTNKRQLRKQRVTNIEDVEQTPMRIKSKPAGKGRQTRGSK